VAYGFQCFDSSGNLIADSSAQTNVLMKIDEVSITLTPSSAGGSPYIYNLVGVSSAADLRDNYIIGRVAGGGGIVFGGTGNFYIQYHSAGKISFTNNSACTVTLTGAYRPCTSADAVTNTYHIYSIGKPVV